MIVADTNLITYLFLGGVSQPAAQAVFEKDPDWTAPFLWRSKFRNVLAGYLRRGDLDLAGALEYMAHADALMQGGEYEVSSDGVLALIDASNCSAYDCEFVELAQELGVPLVTSDARVRAAFSDVAVAPADFVA